MKEIFCRCGKSRKNFLNPKRMPDFYIDECCELAGYDHLGRLKKEDKIETKCEKEFESKFGYKIEDIKIEVESPKLIKKSETEPRIFEVYKENGELVGQFSSKKECAKELNLETSKVYICLTGKAKSHRGYTFKYK